MLDFSPLLHLSLNVASLSLSPSLSKSFPAPFRTPSQPPYHGRARRSPRSPPATPSRRDRRLTPCRARRADHHWKASIEEWAPIVRKSPAGTKCWFEFYRKAENRSYVTFIERKERPA